MTPEKMAERCRKVAKRAMVIMAECERKGTDPTGAVAKLMGFLATDAMRCVDFPGYSECRKSTDGHPEYDAPPFPPEEGGDPVESIRFFRFFSSLRRGTDGKRRKFGNDLLMDLSR